MASRTWLDPVMQAGHPASPSQRESRLSLWNLLPTEGLTGPNESPISHVIFGRPGRTQSVVDKVRAMPARLLKL
jgi:hypothetical protein